MLSDGDIRKAIEAGEIAIKPLHADAIGPCGIDLCLDSVFRIYHPGEPIDIHSNEPLDIATRIVNTGGKSFMILPGQFILGQTVERISLSLSMLVS